MHGVIVRVALGVFGVLSVAILLLAVFNDNGALAVHRQRGDLDKLEAENTKISKENKELADEIQRLKTDPFLIEEIARQYGLVRPGEIVIQFAAPARN